METQRMRPSHTPSASMDYELVTSHEDGEFPRSLHALKRMSRTSLWKLFLSIALFFFALTFTIRTSVETLKYLKLTEIYRPAYRKAPEVNRWQREMSSKRHMNYDECLAVYPGLYDEADRAAKYWEKRGGISMNQVDNAANRGQIARVLIYNGEMYVKRMEWERHSRTRAALALIYEAIMTSIEPIPNIEFVIGTDDQGEADPNIPIFALDRRIDQSNLWLMPDYGFYSWPEPKVGSYSEVVRKAKDFDSTHPWKKKIERLFWKGAFLVPIRTKLYELVRDRNYTWAQIEDINWGDKNTVMTMDQHCDYKYLLHVEGFAYSGRLKYILQCRSVVVAHELEYIQHFHHLIDSNFSSSTQNMVVIPGTDWKDLEPTMKSLLANDESAEQLADQSSKFWQHYISKQSIDCYWRYLFRRYAEVQRFEPKLEYKDTPYVSFNLIGRTDWDPY